MKKLAQFVREVVSFTSQYGDANWRAANLIGPPTSNSEFGDLSTAWCPSQADQNQVLELSFETEVFVEKIRLYENYNGGACTRLEALNPATNEYVQLWSTDQVQHFSHYSIFEPAFKTSTFKAKQIRVSLTFEGRNLFSEIEAVELIGSLINIEPPVACLAADLAKMFLEGSYSDCEIFVEVYFKNKVANNSKEKC